MSWNATSYQHQYSYVWQYGESLLAQLNPQATETILDLGCGTGQLTEQIAASGAAVIGIDSDPSMIVQAQTNYPSILFKVAAAADFQLTEPVDAVFSNAVLHWVTQAKDAARCVAQSLKPNGRFVAELGGKGNVQTILTALEAVSHRTNLNPNPNPNLNPWYFPSLGEYTSLLEQVGFEVIFAQLFDRPTPLGEAGLAGWLEMFSQRFFANLSAAEWTQIVSAVETAASELYREGQWIADYRRLRIIAVKK